MNATEAADRLAGIARGDVKPTVLNVLLRALTNFRLPNGPSSEQPFLNVKMGDKISLDGDEPVTAQQLLDAGYVEYVT